VDSNNVQSTLGLSPALHHRNLPQSARGERRDGLPVSRRRNGPPSALESSGFLSARGESWRTAIPGLVRAERMENQPVVVSARGSRRDAGPIVGVIHSRSSVSPGGRLASAGPSTPSLAARAVSPIRSVVDWGGSYSRVQTSGLMLPGDSRAKERTCTPPTTSSGGSAGWVGRRAGSPSASSWRPERQLNMTGFGMQDRRYSPGVRTARSQTDLGITSRAASPISTLGTRGDNRASFGVVPRVASTLPARSRSSGVAALGPVRTELRPPVKVMSRAPSGPVARSVGLSHSRSVQGVQRVGTGRQSGSVGPVGPVRMAVREMNGSQWKTDVQSVASILRSAADTGSAATLNTAVEQPKVACFHFAATRIQRAWRVHAWRSALIRAGEALGWVGSLSWLRQNGLLYGTELAEDWDMDWWDLQREHALRDTDVDPWGHSQLCDHLHRLWEVEEAEMRNDQAPDPEPAPAPERSAGEAARAGQLPPAAPSPTSEITVERVTLPSHLRDQADFAPSRRFASLSPNRTAGMRSQLWRNPMPLPRANDQVGQKVIAWRPVSTFSNGVIHTQAPTRASPGSPVQTGGSVAYTMRQTPVTVSRV